MNELGPELNWTCGYSPDGPLECLDAATVHGFRLTEDQRRIASMMASCESHRALMRADYEHPMQSACGITRSHFRWPENYCYVDWDAGDHLLSGRELVPARRGES